MIFAKLADNVVKHHKKILVAWIVIVPVSIPAVSKVSDVLAYQESEMVTGDIESLRAQDIIEEQFPTSLANSTLLVVVTGADMTSPEARDFALYLGDLVVQSDEIRYLEDISSVYSLHEQMILGLVLEIGSMTHEGFLTDGLHLQEIDQLLQNLTVINLLFPNR